MTEYLEFTEFDDKTYSDEMENLADEYSVVGSAVKATLGKGHKHLKNTDRNYRKRHWSEVGGRISDRYKHLRKEEKKKKIYKAIKEKAEYTKSNKGPSKDYNDAKISYFKGKKAEKKAQDIANGKVSKHGNLKKGAIAVASGAGGAAIGNVAASKWKKELAVLKVKPNPTPEDLAKMKTLKRKIAAATAVGGAAGVGIGLLAANKYKK
jgi:primosomal protein N'